MWGRSITIMTQYVCKRLRSDYSAKKNKKKTLIQLLSKLHKKLQPNFLYLQTHKRFRTLDQSKAVQERIYSLECCVYVYVWKGVGWIYIGGEGVKL